LDGSGRIYNLTYGLGREGLPGLGFNLFFFFLKKKKSIEETRKEKKRKEKKRKEINFAETITI